MLLQKNIANPDLVAVNLQMKNYKIIFDLAN